MVDISKIIATRHEFLEQLHLALKPKTYLEVGVQHGTSLVLAHGAELAIGIDPIGTRHFQSSNARNNQRIKVTHGPDGTATDASSANPLPVTAPPAARTTHSIAVSLQSDAIMSNLSALTPKFFTETVAAADTDEELVAIVARDFWLLLCYGDQISGCRWALGANRQRL